MQIVKLGIKNFLSLASVEIRPGQVNQIVGANSQGKTSIVKAVDFAVRGSPDGSLVKFGEDVAEVFVELEDGTLITRRVTADGKQSLDVRRDGFKTTSPQAYVDALFDSTAFNPLQVLDPKMRAEAILKSIDIRLTPEILAGKLGVEAGKLPPLDYDQHGLKVLDQCHKFMFQRRAEANKDAAEKRKRFETYKADLPTEVEAPAMNAEELQNMVNSLMETQKRNYEMNMKLLEERISNGRRAIEEARAEMPKSVPNLQPLEQALQSVRNDLSGAGAMRAKIDAYKAIEKQREMVAAIEKEWNTAQAFAESLTERVNALAGPIKAELMAAAEMPVKGLQYADGQFYVEGVAVDNLSSSKALRLSVAVARKLSKKSKLICIDGAEMLDADTYAELREEIANDGFTYFITKVGDAFPEKDGNVYHMHNGGVTTSETTGVAQ